MAFKLINGTTATVAINVAPYVLTGTGTDGYASGTISSGAAGSLKCMFGSLNFTARTNVADEQTVFCSSRWTTPVPGRISGEFSLGGYISSGATYSSPLALIDPTDTPYIHISAQFDAGCSISAPAFFVLDSQDVQAFAQAPRQAQARIVGKPSFGWVVA